MNEVIWRLLSYTTMCEKLNFILTLKVLKYSCMVFWGSRVSSLTRESSHTWPGVRVGWRSEGRA